MKVDFDNLDTESYKITQRNKAYFETFPNCIKWVIDHECIENETSEESKVFNNLIVDRMAIDAIRLFRIAKTNEWIIECKYSDKVLGVDYKDYDRAKAAFKELTKWRFGI